MLLSMGAAPELKPFSNKVTCICIYMDISLLHVPFYFHVYTLYGHNVNYIGFACSHHWENLVIKYLDSKRLSTMDLFQCLSFSNNMCVN